MKLDKIVDPRDNLDRARRKELEHFAKACGVKEIVDGMPAQLMRRILRNRGLTQINVRMRPLGALAQSADRLPPQESTAVTQQAPVAVVDATEDLRRQFEASQQAPVAQKVRRCDLMHECKTRGIPVKHTDKTSDLLEKLNG